MTDLKLDPGDFCMVSNVVLENLSATTNAVVRKTKIRALNTAARHLGTDLSMARSAEWTHKFRWAGCIGGDHIVLSTDGTNAVERWLVDLVTGTVRHGGLA